jgi:hypothetical protein
MIKVMHVDNVFEVFIFLILIFGYFFYARRGAYLMVAIFLKTLNSNFRAKKHFRGHIVHFGAVTHHYIDLTALNAGKGTEIITLSMHTIYHSDHTIPMIPASYRMHG